MNALPFIREPIRANPLPDECDVIARAQSLLTKNGVRGPVLPYPVALRVLKRAERKARVTVPQPQQSRAASAWKAESPTLSLPASATAGTNSRRVK